MGAQPPRKILSQFVDKKRGHGGAAPKKNSLPLCESGRVAIHGRLAMKKGYKHVSNAACSTRWIFRKRTRASSRVRYRAPLWGTVAARACSRARDHDCF